MNITDPIRNRARRNPTSIAVIRTDDTKVSYHDLDRMIDAAAARLAGLGLVPGQVVGLAIRGPDEFPPLVIALALARSGIASADPSLPAEHLDLLLVGPGTPKRTDVRSVAVDASWAALPTRGSVPIAPMWTDGSAVCRIFASSGTTGKPKFIPASHDVMAQRALQGALWIGPPEPVHICALDFGSGVGVRDVLRTLFRGATLVLTNPADAVTAIRRHDVSSISIAPGSLAAFVRSLPADVPPLPLRVVEASGSFLAPQLAELVRRTLGCRVVLSYGATEVGNVAWAPIESLQGIENAVGLVSSGVEVQAVDTDDQPLPPGHDGILRIRSEQSVAGYLDPASSAEAFKDGWFYPGDIGSLTPEGILIVTGRVGDVINAGGVKVHPSVIESVLLTLPGIIDAAAFGVPDAMGVTRIWAAVVSGTPVSGAEVNALCRQKLGIRAPQFVLQVRGLPRNANGKVRRDELMRFAQTQQR